MPFNGVVFVNHANELSVGKKLSALVSRPVLGRVAPPVSVAGTLDAKSYFRAGCIEFEASVYCT